MANVDETYEAYVKLSRAVSEFRRKILENENRVEQMLELCETYIGGNKREDIKDFISQTNYSGMKGKLKASLEKLNDCLEHLDNALITEVAMQRRVKEAAEREH